LILPLSLTPAFPMASPLPLRPCLRHRRKHRRPWVRKGARLGRRFQSSTRGHHWCEPRRRASCCDAHTPPLCHPLHESFQGSSVPRYVSRLLSHPPLGLGGEHVVGEGVRQQRGGTGRRCRVGEREIGKERDWRGQVGASSRGRPPHRGQGRGMSVKAEGGRGSWARDKEARGRGSGYIWWGSARGRGWTDASGGWADVSVS
jgi:hypothetical protein